MDLSLFDFPFDPTLIAVTPSVPRDQARLLVLDRARHSLGHQRVTDLPQLLDPGDLVVINDTKVLAARVRGRKATSKTSLDLLLIRPVGVDVWEVLVKGRLRPGDEVVFPQGVRARVLERGREHTTVHFESERGAETLMDEAGTMPLPPYIKRPPQEEDREWYQTMFARVPGSVAAPTAGLHFTRELVDRLEQRGIRRAAVTLHVGPGTFLPVASEDIRKHRMSAERTEVTPETAELIQETHHAGKRVVAIGTTVVRALESAARPTGTLESFAGQTDLFITPGFEFGVVGGLLTNFHLPRSTLLMLVAAFVGVEPLRAAYREAVARRYRFYSYGDAMLIL